MAGNFDDIIRRALGLAPPEPDEMQPFRGSPLGPMIQDYLDAPIRSLAPIAEGEMLPPTDLEQQKLDMLGGSQQMPFYPQGFPGGAYILPNEKVAPEDLRANRPLRKGNSKTGSGIDV